MYCLNVCKCSFDIHILTKDFNIITKGSKGRMHNNPKKYLYTEATLKKKPLKVTELLKVKITKK